MKEMGLHYCSMEIFKQEGNQLSCRHKHESKAHILSPGVVQSSSPGFHSRHTAVVAGTPPVGYQGVEFQPLHGPLSSLQTVAGQNTLTVKPG